MNLIEVDGQLLDAEEFLLNISLDQDHCITISGMKATLNLFCDGSYALMLKVVLTEDEDGAYDVDRLESKVEVIKDLASKGFFLRGCDGYVACFKDGKIDGLKDALFEAIDCFKI